MLTFEMLREIQLKERQSKELVPLPENFWKEVAEYMKEKLARWEELRKNPSKFADKVLIEFERELKSAALVVQDIYRMREQKIISLAHISVISEEEPDDTSLTPEERALLKELIDALSKSRKEILLAILSGEKAEEEAEEEKEEEAKPNMLKIKILERVPAFLGTDLQLYGPYEPGEVVELPVKYAKLLIEKGKAEIA